MTAAPPAADDPVAVAAGELYGAPLAGFVAERKRLADARKAAGDKAGAAAIAKLGRPAMSAWVVNRLWREDRDEVDGLLAAGAAVRAGDRSALEIQRGLLGRLRARAAAILVGDGHAASPATLQRIATTLQALSALGTWAPDRPGELVADRDPPGFEVMIGAVLDGKPAAPPRLTLVPASAGAPAAATPDADTADAAARRAERRAQAAAERAQARAAERAALAQVAAAAARDRMEKTAIRDRARTEVEAARTTLARAEARCATAEAAQDEAADRAGRADAALAAHDAESEAAARADHDDATAAD